jgi:LysM repeat protein
MKKAALFLCKAGASLALVGVGTSAWTLTHVVRKGETLSEIASRFVAGRIYGVHGSLAKIASLNPEITNLNRIRVGQKLTVPSEKVSAFARTELPNVNRSAAQVTEASAEFSRFEVSAKFLQSRLAATDSSSGGKSTMGSSFSPELGLRWGQHWESGLQSFLAAHFRRESFKTTSVTQTLSDNTPLLYGFALGARLLPVGASGALEASLHLDQESFVRAKSISALTIDSVLVPKAQLLFRTDLRRSRIFRVGSEFYASYLAAVNTASYSTKFGYGAGAAILIHQNRKKQPFFGGIAFDYLSHNTNITRQNYMSLGLKFGISFDIRDEGNDDP